MHRQYPELRLRYKVAYETYYGFTSKNIETLKTGGTPSPEDLADEKLALTRLGDARRAMQDALMSPSEK